MRRFITPTILGCTTVLATVASLVTDNPDLGLLLIVAVGSPLTVFSLVRALADPSREGRSPWLSLVLGATVVPIIVLVMHGFFVALGYNLVAPMVEPTRALWEQLRADPDLFAALTSGWALAFIVELAVVAPLAEESTKPLAALVRRPRSGRDAFVFGAAAGTGFAMVENVLYSSGWFFGSLEGWLPVAVIRMLGAGLHAFGAGLVAWGVYQLRSAGAGRWRRFWLAYGAALTAHGLWNGSAAVTIALATARESGGLRGRIDAYSWGVVLLVLLAALGVLITGALLLAAIRIRQGESPLRVLPMRDARTPQSIAAWALVSTTFLIPVTILVLVYPDIVAL